MAELLKIARVLKVSRILKNTLSRAIDADVIKGYSFGLSQIFLWKKESTKA